MMKVAVVGASGFVGNALVDRLRTRPDVSVVPLIRSSGNAWRLAKRAIEPRVVNLFSLPEITAALTGCTHVVNCSRGDDRLMIQGLGNLLKAAVSARVEAFVHLSSVMVYGDPPTAASASEDAVPPRLAKGTYGRTKLMQDRMVEKVAANGLPSLILCPPNISGPYSPYFNALVDALRAKEFALLDDGNSPCNVVDVDNLCRAIELGLDKASKRVTRIFVTDDHPTSWREVIDGLGHLAEVTEPVPTVSRESLERTRHSDNRSRVSVARSLKHLVSSDMRTALRKDPMWQSLDGVIRRGAALLGSAVEDRLRLSIEGPLPVHRTETENRLNLRLCAQQLRGVQHSCDLAKKTLGYVPLHSFSESMTAYQRWYRRVHHMDGPDWELLRQFY